jgi:hypothetical protein
MTTFELSEECNKIYDRAATKLGLDLNGYSVLDLCADNITDASLEDLKYAIWISGIQYRCSERIRQQIATYR